MAVTTKTLTPTNQTVTLPDMTERPNASVLVDGIGKEADVINALSDQIAKAIAYSDVEDTTTASGNISLTNYKPSGYNVPIFAYPITPTSNTYYNCLITYYSGQYFVKVMQSNMTVLASTAVKLRVYWLKHNTAP